MAKDTAISWTDHTFCPWWGCEKVSPACAHCYAETFAERWPASRGLWGRDGKRKFQSDKYWNTPLKWDRDAARGICSNCGLAKGAIDRGTCKECGSAKMKYPRPRVFCASMADVFEDREELVPHRARLFDLIRRTPNLDWLLLTKRPENVMRQIKHLIDLMPVITGSTVDPLFKWLAAWEAGTAPANVWLGTTVENQEMADKRIPELLKIPAKTRFLSCEPLLGPVDFTQDRVFPRKLFGECGSSTGSCTDNSCRSKIDWVICGGESGPHARPMHPDWAISLRDQCAAARVPFHFKQWGCFRPAMPSDFDEGAKGKTGWVTLEGKTYWAEHPRQGSDELMLLTSAQNNGRLLNGQLHDAFPI